MSDQLERQDRTAIFFIGSYTEADSSGVYVCSLDLATGAIEVLRSYAGLQNPTFLSVNANARKLYAITERKDAQSGDRIGAAAAFHITDNVELSLLNIEETVPSPTCHIELDRTGRSFLVSSYHGGMVGLSKVKDDGSAGPASDIKRHEGSSVLPVQSQPRAHSATMDPHNRFAVVCDLGTDRIVTYKVDPAEGKLTRQQDVQVAPGAGPRHFAFHPSKPLGYVINELNATITCFNYDESTGMLTEFQTVPTLPADYQGDNACADIHISADGQFLYGSNRGHDSIAVYRISDEGELTLVEHSSVLGEHPRNFALSSDPANSFLLAANRDTNNVVVFARDENTGKLTPVNQSITLPKPVCIKFL